MPKQSRNPVILDNCITLTVADIRKKGLLTPNQINTDSFNWKEGFNKEVVATIHITVNMLAQNPYVEFQYNYGQKLINYQLQLVSLPSNIGESKIWYFLCSETNKRCWKLHLINGYFVHRSDDYRAVYKKDTYGKNTRFRSGYGKRLAKAEKEAKKLTQSYFRTHYNGQPTKSYMKIKSLLRPYTTNLRAL